ncbi:hypothetical protein AAC387_Pa12g2021 [Persea americana]
MAFSKPPFPLLFVFISLSAAITHATVPPTKTFTYINQGPFGDYNIEYGANYRVLDIFTYPFRLCFYNTTPNAYTLALRMGARPSESVMRWVWDANRANPVRENATLSFRRDGNLVLSDADGRVAWQTGTANKGVVGLRLLPNGNLVLHDQQGRFLWQSFDHPTDTLLVGQALRSRGPTKLVSRVSNVDGSDGPYSFVLEAKRVSMYFKDPSSSVTLLYNTMLDTDQGPFSQVAFASVPETAEGLAYELGFEPKVGNTSYGLGILGLTKYNSTTSYLRLGTDGNVKINTLYDKASWRLWEVTFTLFSRDSLLSECSLPRRCGSFGLCEEDQCVACPSPKGLLGWSSGCAPPKLGPCNGRSKVDYYKVVGVEHFMSRYSEGDGPMKVGECRDKCSKDCKCVGFFYREESSKCLLAPVLGTLTKVSNSSHVGFIKVSK